jgi:hypothetical protein
LANRDHPDVFTEELEKGSRIIAVLPGAGAPYPQSPVPGVRRIYLRKVDVHLYYTFNDDRVIVRDLWVRVANAVRGSSKSPCGRQESRTIWSGRVL